MSSMFKKKGGLAFKPKAPVARARPQAQAAKPTPTSTSTPTPTSTSQSAIEAPPETTREVEKEPALSNNEPQTSPQRRRDSQAAVEAEPKEQQNEAPAASRPSSRRASHSQQLETAPGPRIRQMEKQATQSDANMEPDPVVVETAKVAPPLESPSGPSTQRQPTTQPSPQPSIETTTITAEENAPSTDHPPASRPTDSLNESQSAPTAPPSEEPAAASTSKPAPERATRKPRTPSAPSAENAPPTDNETAEGEPSRPKKRQKRAPRQQTGETRTPAAPRKRKPCTPNANASRSSSRRARSLTPEDAETQVVDLQKLKMSDLTKDLRIGKKFSRHDELRERERKARLKAKVDKDGQTANEAGGENNNNNNNNNKTSQSQSPAPVGTRSNSNANTPSGTSSTPAPAAPAATTGPQFRIVNGQIVIDQASLVMDRHARAAAAQAHEAMETIEENDFTRLITSSSFMTTSKLKGPNIWTESETELFYRGLRMFGTEFEMISKMFPGKQRRHIKLKFNREERHNPQRIDAAVMGEKTIKMDLDEYRAFTGAEFEPVEDIEAEQRKIEEGYEAERQRVADEQAEIMRKKREELFADDEEDVGAEAAGKRKGKGRKRAGGVSYGLNGEPIVQ